SPNRSRCVPKTGLKGRSPTEPANKAFSRRIAGGRCSAVWRSPSSSSGWRSPGGYSLSVWESDSLPCAVGFSNTIGASTPTRTYVRACRTPSGYRIRCESAVCSYFFRSEEHTSELQSRFDLVCRLLLEKKEKS